MSNDRNTNSNYQCSMTNDQYTGFWTLVIGNWELVIAFYPWGNFFDQSCFSCRNRKKALISARA